MSITAANVIGVLLPATMRAALSTNAIDIQRQLLREGVDARLADIHAAIGGMRPVVREAVERHIATVVYPGRCDGWGNWRAA